MKVILIARALPERRYNAVYGVFVLRLPVDPRQAFAPARPVRSPSEPGADAHSATSAHRRPVRPTRPYFGCLIPLQQRKIRPDSSKKDAVRRLMARGSKTASEVAKELGVSPSMLHRWREQFEPEPSGTILVTQGEREDVERLRRELRDLQTENPLPKKQPSSRRT